MHLDKWEVDDDLIYLYSLSRDDKKQEANSFIPEKTKTREEELMTILSSMDLPFSRQMRLFNKLNTFWNAKDCVHLNVAAPGPGEYAFTFTRKNQYIETADEFLFYPEMDVKRIFQDCYSSHSHDNLIKDKKFQEMIRKTGMEFLKCDGGYVTEYSMADDKFIMKDETEVKVYFKAGLKKRIYHLDLDRMELGKDYWEV